MWCKDTNFPTYLPNIPKKKFESNAGGWWVGGLGCMEENKKSGGGDVRAEALSWDNEWDKT